MIATAPPTLQGMLEQRVATRPTDPLIRFRDRGIVRDVSSAELRESAGVMSRALRATGIEDGDVVAVFLPNCLECVVLWFALPMVGAIEVPVNIEQRGLVLEHVLRDSGATLIVTRTNVRDHIASIAHDLGIDIVDVGDLDADHDSAESRSPRPVELSTIMYTSGTTGPSKGVRLSHGYLGGLGARTLSMYPSDGGDVYYFCSPMFHIDARCMMSAALTTGGCLAFAERFSASGFWNDIVEFDVTFFLFIGAMLSILAKTSSIESVDIGRLRSGTGAPIPAEAYEFFEDGLGVRLIEVYGMTESAAVTWSTPERSRRGSAGYAAGPFEVAIVDADDNALAPGEVGEIVFRPLGPELVTSGYWNRPDATVATFRNLWLHSGDLGRLDEDGFLWFVGRDKDMIRRRGENISAYEVEATINQLPGVLESAALPVAGDVGGEEELLVLVVPKPGVDLTASDVLHHAEQNLARFAQPRWIDLVEDLPHTPTGKLAKHLIAHSVSPTAYDTRSK